ncbi:MAG: hypothetical protein ABSF67_08005 [Roseiarcus sp.]
MVRNRLRWRLADELQRQVGFECVGLEDRKAIEIADLVRPDIPILNDVRAEPHGGTAPEGRLAKVAAAGGCKYLHEISGAFSCTGNPNSIKMGSLILLMKSPLWPVANGRLAEGRELRAMFKEMAKKVHARLGLATIARNKLSKSNLDVVCELVKDPSDVEIVRSTSVEAAVATPEVKLEAEPVVAADTVKFVVRIRSMSDKWITLCEPMPNGGTIWVYRPHLLAINHLPGSDNSELVVPLKVAKKKGWAA